MIVESGWIANSSSMRRDGRRRHTSQVVFIQVNDFHAVVDLATGQWVFRRRGLVKTDGAFVVAMHETDRPTGGIGLAGVDMFTDFFDEKDRRAALRGRRRGTVALRFGNAAPNFVLGGWIRADVVVRSSGMAAVSAFAAGGTANVGRSAAAG